jgi:NAD(P)-dependent dehydrogenase (short-subunit alcohol dehydrogenase family)
MIKQKQGQIVNILATYAWTGGPGTIHSACAKAGVLAMTRTLAVEWARYGIRVNAISPGAFETEGARDRLWPMEEIRTAIINEIPLKRFASPVEVVMGVLYLVSPYAAYINGECLVMDGGAWLGKGIANLEKFVDKFDKLREAREKSKS